jgi:uncharacterized protein with NAD-binding domain and iron-sulfur cluster
MAGLAAACGSANRAGNSASDAITVYQRGWRPPPPPPGGKGAPARRARPIEEQGLHIWLGSYENAFTLLRACYDET